MRARAITAAAAALATTLALTGCSAGPAGTTGSDMPGMGGASSSPGRSSSANDADVAFATMMTMHHRQAIEMSDMLLAKTGVDPAVTALAEKIKAAQTSEITLMRGWVKSWGRSADMSGMSGMAMDGMMSDSDMKALENASGADASSLFLTQMIRHHRGAIDMARREVSDGRNPDAIALAKKIVDDQTAEIATMQGLLAAR